MGKSKRHSGRKIRRSRHSQPPAPPTSKSHKWLLIFCVITCVVIAALWGIKSLSPSHEKTQKEQSPPILSGQPKPSTVPSKLTAEQEIAALKEEEFGLSEQLLREFPNSEVPLLLTGNIQRKYGNSAEAVKFWEKALDEDGTGLTDLRNALESMIDDSNLIISSEKCGQDVIKLISYTNET